MAYTNYGTIKTDVMNKIGIDDDDVEDVVEQSLNDILQEICQASNFSWLYGDSSFITTAVYEAGSLTATEGGTTLTGSSTIWTSAMVGRKIRIENATYDISAYTSGTDLTLSTNYAGAGGSGLGYTIFQGEYSLSSDVEDVLSMYQENYPHKLDKVGIEVMDMLYPSGTASGYPYKYSIVGYDSSGYMKVAVYPIPQLARNVYYRFKYRVTEMSSDSDTPIIPLRYRWVLAKGGVYQVAKYLDMPQIGADFEREYRQGIAQLIAADKKLDERIIKGSHEEQEEQHLVILNT